MKLSLVNTLSILLLLSLGINVCQAQLKFGYYRGKCGFNDVEIIIRRVVAARFARDPTITPALIRMQFHDCFVSGCDASLLLEGKSSEKTAIPNLTVRGYDIIDQAKTEVEKVCPGLVSCADIIVAATRDAIALAGGWPYAVQMGRRDGKVSLASNVDLPPPSISVAQSIAAFQKKNLTTTDMVLLLGGHTVGIAHCSTFVNRLYNFNGTQDADKTMDPNLVKKLRTTCPQNAKVDNFTNLDQNMYSSNIIDKSYYNQILMKKGILEIDQRLALDPATKNTVTSLAKGYNFPFLFNNAMVKMGAIQVLTAKKHYFVVVLLLVVLHQAKKPMWNPSCLKFLSLLLHLSVVTLLVSAEDHGNPANEIVELINQNRTSSKLPKLYDSAGLGCMALQYISECTGNCSKNNTMNCRPPEVDITEVYAPNCGVELPTVGIISGHLLGCHWNDLSPEQAFSSVLIQNKQMLTLLLSKEHTEVGVGFSRTHRGPNFWCALFSSGKANSSFVLEGGQGIKQRSGCFSGIDLPCSTGTRRKLLFSEIFMAVVLVMLLSCSMES
ncbi:hypothetical protein J5N97_029458 [Dioscorea zingiberensis]|uniref:peroxidase n=1 Tax=Dioscorea zingiberensis TaxID=325984 RepID=A0A9D5H5N4_9LILI|nr:hypothetical protein J5N97_029458 [Dioscorea zingiberensis]